MLTQAAHVVRTMVNLELNVTHSRNVEMDDSVEDLGFNTHVQILGI